MELPNYVCLNYSGIYVLCFRFDLRTRLVSVSAYKCRMHVHHKNKKLSNNRIKGMKNKNVSTGVMVLCSLHDVPAVPKVTHNAFHHFKEF